MKEEEEVLRIHSGFLTIDPIDEDGEFTSSQSNQRLQFAEVALNAYTAHHFPTTEIEPGLRIVEILVNRNVGLRHEREPAGA